MNYESNLINLCERLLNKTYEPKKSICFISFYPVQREVFAAQFEDRIIHHLIYNYINNIFEEIFIHDSYSCRKNKGTSYGIGRLNKAIRGVSDNYTKDAYILKLDIKSYFMSIDKNILFKDVEKTLYKFRYKLNCNLDFLLWIIKIVIFHNPVKNVIIKGSRKDWQGLPKSKSLFLTKENKGLPIGNLTSQLFGNIYLDCMDKYIKDTLGFKYYGRYVDDFYILDKSKNRLKDAIRAIRNFIKKKLGLILHPNKIYLQHFTKGVKFLGVFLKPYRIYVDKRIKKSFYTALDKEYEDISSFVSSVNSYLGFMSNYDTFNLRKKLLFNCNNTNFRSGYMVNDKISKIVLNKR